MSPVGFSVTDMFAALGKIMTAKEYAAIQPTIADFMSKLSALHADNERLSGQNVELRRKVDDFESFAAEAAKYTVRQEDTGVVTYSAAEGGTIRLCANCFQNRRIRYLQPTHRTELNTASRAWYRVHECTECGAKLCFGKTSDYRPPAAITTTF